MFFVKLTGYVTIWFIVLKMLKQWGRTVNTMIHKNFCFCLICGHFQEGFDFRPKHEMCRGLLCRYLICSQGFTTKVFCEYHWWKMLINDSKWKQLTSHQQIREIEFGYNTKLLEIINFISCVDRPFKTCKITYKVNENICKFTLHAMKHEWSIFLKMVTMGFVQTATYSLLTALPLELRTLSVKNVPWFGPQSLLNILFMNMDSFVNIMIHDFNQNFFRICPDCGILSINWHSQDPKNHLEHSPCCYNGPTLCRYLTCGFEKNNYWKCKYHDR